MLKNLPDPQDFQFFSKNVQMLKPFSEVYDVTFKTGKNLLLQAWKMGYFY